MYDISIYIYHHNHYCIIYSYYYTPLYTIQAEASQRASNGENGASFHQASFMSYNNTGGGTPKVFQASTATRSGPGGVSRLSLTCKIY